MGGWENSWDFAILSLLREAKVDPRSQLSLLDKPGGNRRAMEREPDIWSNFPSSQICNFLIINNQSEMHNVYEYSDRLANIYSESSDG